jgi:two-component system, response regulator, stage 0 sporulation protein A
MFLKPFDLDTLVDRIRQLHGNPNTRTCLPVVGYAANPKPASLNVEVTNIIHEIGVPRTYQRVSVFTRGDHVRSQTTWILSAVTKELYPSIAERFNSTP